MKLIIHPQTWERPNNFLPHFIGHMVTYPIHAGIKVKKRPQNTDWDELPHHDTFQIQWNK